MTHNRRHESECVNISKSKFFAQQITSQGIQSICNKVEMDAILNIKVPKTRKELDQYASLLI
jgi:hypothetical protein